MLNDFDKVFIENGIAEGLESKSFVDLTTDITSCGDIITLDSRPHPYGARHDPIGRPIGFFIVSSLPRALNVLGFLHL